MELIQGIADSLVGISAVAVAIIAYLGLKTWKKELIGKTELEVAQDLLEAVFRMRDSIRDCRASEIDFMSEFPEPNKNSTCSKEEDIINCLFYTYENRFQKILEGIPELKVAAREAEVLWGAPINKKVAKFNDCIDELKGALREVFVIHLRTLNEKGEKEIPDNIRQIISDETNSVKAKNQFTERINAAVADIEKTIRPHLGC